VKKTIVNNIEEDIDDISEDISDDEDLIDI